MSMWNSINQFIRGGWRTYGPAGGDIPGPFDSRSDPLYDSVAADTAIKLSAWWACLHLRAETLGTLPINVRDKNKKVLDDHPLQRVLKYSPNVMQTGAEYLSQQIAHVDMHGNGYSIIHREGDRIVMLEPVPNADEVTLVQGKRLSNIKYQIGTDKFFPEEILHQRGFTFNNYMGISRLSIGQAILASQMTGNAYAQKAFKQGLKVGGFFKVERSLEKPELDEFKKRLDIYALPENAGKWMALLKGMEPVGGAQFAIKPAEAELLASRYFGIEEICRLCNVPPQLIGHSDKASSWASSLENINLFFLIYSLMPTIVRFEQRFNKMLLSADDIGRGVHVKFNFAGLVRGDLRTQMMMFASGLQNGYLNRNEVRDLLDRAGIGPEGEKYLVQMNMAQTGDKPPVANE